MNQRDIIVLRAALRRHRHLLRALHESEKQLRKHVRKLWRASLRGPVEASRSLLLRELIGQSENKQ